MKEQKCAVLVKLPEGNEVYWNCEIKTNVGDTAFCKGQSGVVLEVLDWLDIQDFPCVDAVEESYKDMEYDPRVFEIADDVLLKYHGTDERVQVPSCVKVIGNWAFEGDFDEIDLPESVERVSAEGFSSAPHIGSVIVHGDTVFEKPIFPRKKPLDYNEKDGCLYLGCPEHPYLSLMGVSDPTLPEIIPHPECRSISEGAFDNAKAAKRVVIPDGVTRVAKEALVFCSKMKKLEIGAGLPMSEDEFYEVSRTVKVTLSPDNPYLKQVEKNILTADGKTLLFGVCGPIPEGVITIGKRAFIAARKVGDIELPEGVETIREYAFGNTDITSINFPSTLKQVAHNAFYETEELTSPIRFRGTRAQWKAVMPEKSILKEVFCETEPDSFLAKVTAYGLTVKFPDKKKYRFNCDFAVQLGDQVKVSGPRAGEIGTVVQIDEGCWTNRSNTNKVTEVLR